MIPFNNSWLEKIGQEVINTLQNVIDLHLLLGILTALMLFFLFISIKTSIQNRRLKKLFEQLSQEHEGLSAAYTAQDEAIKAETVLRQSVEESLRAANRIAEAASQSKTEFMATIGHEIRTPLNGIIPILEILSDTSLDDEQLQMVQTALQSSLHLLRLINDILDFSKAEVGKLEIESIEIDLKALVFSITDLMKQSAEKKGLKLEVSLSSKIPVFLRGDSLRIKQIITNLLSNALKFTDKGKILLNIEIKKEEFRFVYILFTVKDTGIGMSETVRQKLFTSFTQADASTTRLHGGTGLGLAICKRLVELMGGEIDVKSVEGKGSNFWFVLPLRKSLRDVPALRENLEDARIMYFRKSQLKLDVHKQIEEGCKIDIESTDSLDKITSRLKNSQKPGESGFVDLVVVDVMGSEFTAANDISKIKQQVTGTFSQILAINALPALSSELKNSGADAVMLRPFNVEVFRQQVYRLLDIGLYQVVHEMPDDLTLFGGMFGQGIEDASQEKLAQSVKVNDLKFSGKVLLAEDNPINRSVIEKMLGMFGLEVVTVEEGFSAVKQMKEERFDLVFMDCQMPRIDGFEATKLWRAYEKDHANSLPGHLPIIAITANAMREDRQQCIDAQMDDYLPKPISRAALGVVLKIWMPPDKVVENVHGLSQDKKLEADENNSELDQATLSELRDVMDEDFDHIIHSYIKHSTELISSIKQLMNSGELAEIQRLVHSFKSSSKNVGAVKLGNKAYEIEKKLAKGDQSGLSDDIQRLIINYDKVVKALKNLLTR